MDTEIITETDAFFSKFEDLKATDKYWIAYISGSTDEQGVSWCSDCNTAKPILEQAFESSLGDKTLVKATVTRDEWKGNKDHPYRTHASLKLGGVPTLVVLKGAHQLAKLEEGELFELETVEEVLSTFK